jgi:hypothetical protein
VDEESGFARVERLAIFGDGRVEMAEVALCVADDNVKKKERGSRGLKRIACSASDFACS